MTAAQRGWLLPPLALFLAAGILLGRAAGSWLYGALGCVLALAGCLMLRGMGRFCACLALALCLGCLRGYFAFHPSLPEEGGYRITGVVCAEVESRSSGQIRTVLTHVELDGVPLAGNAYWTFYADAAPADLLPGRFVSFLGSVYHPSGPSNPDGYDFREELLRQGIRTGVYGSRDLAVDKPGFFSLMGAAAALRHRLTEALTASPMGPEAGAYAAAMLLGNRSLVPREDRTAFSRLGIAHILSVSGFHTGVLIGFLALLFRLLRMPQWLRMVLYALFLSLYVLLCGSAQPVIRASLLLLLMQGGRILQRPRSLVHLLSAVFLVMLLFSPVQLTGLSFQLSFSAVLGLALITPFLSSLRKPENALRRRLWDSLSAGAGAQIGILLPELYAFQELPLLALVLNIPMLAFSALLIGFYWAALAVLPLPGISGLVCRAAGLLTDLMLSAVRFLGQLPGITLWTKAPNLLSAAGFLLLLAGLCALFRWKSRTRGILCASGTLLLTLSLIPLPHLTTEYLQFSVGDADAALLWDRDTVLVMDAGYEDGVLSDYLHRRRLTPTAVVLTHLHADHVMGLRSLREDGIPVSVVYLPEGAEAAAVHPDVLQLLADLRSEGTEFRTLSAGDRIPLPSGEMQVLWPEKGRVRPGQEANESSLVTLLRIRETSLLQTGDLDGRYEMYSAVPANLLKVAHHGSSHSSSEAYLASVHPQAALLSCGDSDRHLMFRERLPEDTVLFSTAAGGMLTVHFPENRFFSVETFLPVPSEESWRQ